MLYRVLSTRSHLWVSCRLDRMQWDLLRSLRWWNSSGPESGRHLYLRGLGVLYRLRDQGDPEQLARLMGAMHQLREMMGIGWGKIVSTAIPFLPIASEALCTRLGYEAFEAALARGRALSFPQMAALIGDVLDVAAHGDAAKKLSHEEASTLLSPREQDVLRLVMRRAVEADRAAGAGAEPTLAVTRPYAYLFPPSLAAVAENLQRHGIAVEELREDIELAVGLIFSISGVGMTYKLCVF